MISVASDFLCNIILIIDSDSLTASILLQINECEILF